MSQTVQMVNEQTQLIATAPAKSLAAVTATGAGTVNAWGSVRSNHALQVVFTGSPSSVIVTLEGSLDGAHWTTIATWSTGGGQSSGDTVWSTGKAAAVTRANLTTLTGGTSPTVTATIAAA